MNGTDLAKRRHGLLLAAFVSTAAMAFSNPVLAADAPQRHYDRDADCSLFDNAAYPAQDARWDGPCVGGLASGRGTARFLSATGSTETILGNFRDGILLDGDADIRWSDGRHYVGSVVAGRPDGRGRLADSEGNRFDGSWKQGALDGQGSVEWSNGDRYDGTWLNGKAEGLGTQLWANGQKYEGLWHNDRPNGKGTLTRADGSSISATFVDGKPAPSDAAPAAGSPEPASHAPRNLLGAIVGSTLVGADGSSIALTETHDGFVRTIRAADGTSQTVTFTFLGDGLGSVTQGTDSPRASGVFHVVGSRLALDFADGHSEALTPNGTDGLLLVSISPLGETACTTWYAPGHAFSVAERKAALAAYARRLGLASPVNAAPMECAAAPASQGGTRRAAASAPTTHHHAGSTTHLSDALPAPSATGSLETVPVKTSTVHLIDAAPPAPDQTIAPPTPADERVASNCLKVDSDGSYWGFRNHCSYSVQYSFCLLHSADDTTACPVNGSASLSGSVAPNGFGPLFATDGLGDPNVEQKFRWVGCRGGAGEVVAHLDQAEPPSGRCVGKARQLAQGN